jgi:polar amino acid transport system substrate-binding protein
MRLLVQSAVVAVGIALAPSLSLAETLTVLAGPIEPYAIEKGDRPGVAVEVLTEMAKRAGIQLTVKFEPWTRAQTDAQAGKEVAILPLTRTPEREAKYVWIVPLLSDPLYLTATRKDLDIVTLAKAQALSVAVLRSTPEEDVLRKAGLAKLELTTDGDSGAKLLKAGRVDAWYTRGMVASFAYTKNGGDAASLLRGANTETPPMYLGGSLDFPKELGAKLTKALDSMKADGRYDQIVKSYQ